MRLNYFQQHIYRTVRKDTIRWQGPARGICLPRVCLWALCLLILAGSAWAQPPSPGPCPGATALTLTDTSLVERDPTAPLDRYEATFVEAGVFSVRLSTPDVSQPAAVLALTDGSCTPAPKAVVESIRQTPQGVILRIKEAGSLRLEVAPEDPLTTLDRYKLQTAFSADPTAPGPTVDPSQDPPAVCGSSEPEGFSFGSGSQSEASSLDGTIDPWDCDVVSGELTGGGVLILEGSGADVEAALYEDDGCTEELGDAVLDESGVLAAAVPEGEPRLVLDPHGGSSGSYTVDTSFYPLCALGSQDDHGDTPLCGTEVSYPSVTTGFGGAGGDEDIVTFRLGQQEDAEITLTGGGGLHCQLFDGAGQRLSEWSECEGGLSETLYITLGAGRYYVVVAGAGAQGASFSLALGSVASP